MTPDSLLFGDNAAYLDDLYLQWLENPTSVEPRFAALFASFERPAKPPRPAAPDTRSIFNPGAAPTPAPALASAATAAVDPRTLLLAQATPRLINAFRVRGHMLADIDPLARLERHEHAELTPAWYGLTEADFGREVDTTPLMGIPPLTGFMGKLYVFAAVIEKGPSLWWFAVVGAVNAAIAAWYYARVMLSLIHI